MRYSLPGFILTLASLGLVFAGLTQVDKGAIKRRGEEAMIREHKEMAALIPVLTVSSETVPVNSIVPPLHRTTSSPHLTTLSPPRLPTSSHLRSFAASPHLLTSLPLTGDITQGFGCSPYYTGLTGPGCPAETPWFHDGLDIGATAGTPVRAALTGTVRFAGPDGSGPLCNGGYHGYGLAVVLDNGTSWQSLYGHLSHIAVVAGQNVTEETIIGYVGDTGCVSGPHLHFGLRYEGNLINPERMNESANGE